MESFLKPLYSFKVYSLFPPVTALIISTSSSNPSVLANIWKYLSRGSPFFDVLKKFRPKMCHRVPEKAMPTPFNLHLNILFNSGLLETLWNVLMLRLNGEALYNKFNHSPLQSVRKAFETKSNSCSALLTTQLLIVFCPSKFSLMQACAGAQTVSARKWLNLLEVGLRKKPVSNSGVKRKLNPSNGNLSFRQKLSHAAFYLLVRNSTVALFPAWKCFYSEADVKI